MYQDRDSRIEDAVYEKKITVSITPTAKEGVEKIDTSDPNRTDVIMKEIYGS